MRYLKILFSTKATVLLLLIYAAAMASATFVENSLDTITAKKLIYNAWWFELIMLLLAINFIGNVSKYNLLSIKRLGGLVMHLAFVVMILGAAVTRYFGFEGNMHIREGASSNIIYSTEPVIQVKASDGAYEYTSEQKVLLSRHVPNDFNMRIEASEGPLIIEYKRFVPNATEMVEEHVDGGSDIIELTVATIPRPVYLKKGSQSVLGSTGLAYDAESAAGIRFTTTDSALIMQHDDSLIVRDMVSKNEDTLAPGQAIAVKEKSDIVFKSGGLMFSVSGIYHQAITRYVPYDEKPSGIDAVVLDVSYKNRHTELTVLGGAGYLARYQKADLDNIDVEVAFGDQAIELPFSLKLNDFILDRYAGSMSPSSFESKVEVVDNELDQPLPYDIYMNHVLDYNGYRFFQSSYDKDEQGTVLSVNHDKAGTWISYTGYMLLVIGFILIFFSRKSRFLALREELKKIRMERRALAGMVTVMIGLSSFCAGAAEGHKVPPKEQADQFARLIVQSHEGRLMPVHSLALNILHKISRKDQIEMDGEFLTPTQFLLDLMLDQDHWLDQKMIYIREQSVRDAIGVEGKYASIGDFYDLNNLNADGYPRYKLAKDVQEAFARKPAEKNRFDREIIKVDERVNVFSMAARGTLLRCFPDPDQSRDSWISPDDERAKTELTGAVSMINKDLKMSNLSYFGIFQSYLMALNEGNKNGDYELAGKILSRMRDIQLNANISDELPDGSTVSCEIWYNNVNIFSKLKFFYALMGMILLILTLYTNTKTRQYPVINGLIKMFTLALLLGMVLHIVGLILRWVITGHAPWSNGYEALLLVSLACLIAGFSFYKSSKITLAATAVMAFLMLMTAGHSSYDPQLTNLQPVLKSYWLIIHVAVITISYGFLGMGFILGLLTLFLYVFRRKKNARHQNLLIKELSGINEVGLEIGLVLVSCGTFLGGVWANESWGRYWGWDAKETWSLISIIIYSVVLHLRLVPKLNKVLAFNIGSVLAFGSILMTFIGVNYYFSKGLHSYASGDTPAFPVWAWILIAAVLALIAAAWIKQLRGKDMLPHNL